MTSADALTDAQQRIVSALARFEREDRPAFVPELVEALGLAAESSLTPTLKILERKEVIEVLGGGKQRAYRLVRLTAKGRRLVGLGGLPLLGAIPAGRLKEALAQPAEYLALDHLLPTRTGDFLLRADGDSMIGDGIHDGDLVLIRPGVEVRSGEIAAAYVGEDYRCTLKHVHFERSRVRLKASNPAYDDILVPESEWRGVAGVYRGLVRHVG